MDMDIPCFLALIATIQGELADLQRPLWRDDLTGSVSHIGWKVLWGTIPRPCVESETSSATTITALAMKE